MAATINAVASQVSFAQINCLYRLKQRDIQKKNQHVHVY